MLLPVFSYQGPKKTIYRKTYIPKVHDNYQPAILCTLIHVLLFKATFFIKGQLLEHTKYRSRYFLKIIINRFEPRLYIYQTFLVQSKQIVNIIDRFDFLQKPKVFFFLLICNKKDSHDRITFKLNTLCK